ncbi:hypothetical protein [Tenacibaculum agarivorans]|uniref:hypothetical protein n=1 Tax=Tenacibaculum agarivorans TaxID=1908389 RepID=UPI00094BBC68|nr:hypothetical protein [Tenacibaculum agarivorans]
MKKLFKLTILASLLLFSCNSDDDNGDSEAKEQPISIDFITGEKWFIESINSSNGTNSLVRFDDCNRDDFYVFSPETNTVVKNDSTQVCDITLFPNGFIYGQDMLSIEVENDLIGSISILSQFIAMTCNCGTMINVKGYTSDNGVTKFLVGEIHTTTTEPVIYTYTLRADINNRP